MTTADSEALAICRQSALRAIEVLNKNTELQDIYNKVTLPLYLEAKELRELRRKEHEARLSRYTNKTGEYSIYQTIENTLKNEERQWNNCVLWPDTSPGMHNDWCANDLGEGWYHTGQSSGGCLSGQGKGICKRTNSKVLSDNIDYINARPTFTEPEIEIPQQPILTQPNDVTCCANIVSTLGSTLNDTNISQLNTCVENPNTTPTAQAKVTEKKDIPDNTIYYIIGIIVAIFVVCASIASVIALTL